MCNTLKEHTKYAHTVRGRPTLKDVERFWNGSVREHYERSLYERTFMTNLAIYFNKNMKSKHMLWEYSFSF